MLKKVRYTARPSELAVSVSSIKTVSQGSVLIECNDKSSLEKLQNKVVNELGSDYDIKIPKTIRPKILIVGVREENLRDNQMFIDGIRSQNPLLKSINQDEIRFVRKYKPKNKIHFNVVLEIPPQYFTQILYNQKIFIGWNSCPVYEFIGVLRCFKCWRFGHKAGECRQEKSICPLCNENHSSNSECPVDKIECTNCKYASEVIKVPNITFNHTVFDKNCKSYLRALEQAKSKIEYQS